MLYIGGDRLENDRILAAYALIGAKKIIRDVVNAVLDTFVDNLIISVAENEDSPLVDITDELKNAGWTVFNCPAFEKDNYMYCIHCTFKDFDDHQFRLSVISNQEDVVLEIVGDESLIDEESSTPPFYGFADIIESNAYYNYGYRDGILDYRSILTRRVDQVQPMLEDIEGNDLVQFGIGDLYQGLDMAADTAEDVSEEDAEDDGSVIMVPSQELAEYAKEILERTDFDGRKIGEVILSNPIVSIDNEELVIAVMFTEYSPEEAEKGYIGRPTGVVMFDIQGNPIKIGLEKYMDENPGIKRIDGTEFPTAIENIEELDFSDQYYEEAYELLDTVRLGLLADDELDCESLEEYMDRVMNNVPESYRPFYYAISYMGKDTLA